MPGPLRPERRASPWKGLLPMRGDACPLAPSSSGRGEPGPCRTGLSARRPTCLGKHVRAPSRSRLRGSPEWKPLRRTRHVAVVSFSEIPSKVRLLGRHHPCRSPWGWGRRGPAGVPTGDRRPRVRLALRPPLRHSPLPGPRQRRPRPGSSHARLHVVSLGPRTQERRVTALPRRPLVHASAPA